MAGQDDDQIQTNTRNNSRGREESRHSQSDQESTGGNEEDQRNPPRRSRDNLPTITERDQPATVGQVAELMKDNLNLRALIANLAAELTQSNHSKRHDKTTRVPSRDNVINLGDPREKESTRRRTKDSRRQPPRDEVSDDLPPPPTEADYHNKGKAHKYPEGSKSRAVVEQERSTRHRESPVQSPQHSSQSATEPREADPKTDNRGSRGNRLRSEVRTELAPKATLRGEVEDQYERYPDRYDPRDHPSDPPRQEQRSPKGAHPGRQPDQTIRSGERDSRRSRHDTTKKSKSRELDNQPRDEDQPRLRRVNVRFEDRTEEELDSRFLEIMNRRLRELDRTGITEPPVVAHRHPFTQRIMRAEIPSTFKPPSFHKYDGTSDPNDHLSHFSSAMVLYGNDDIVSCRAFPSSLVGAAAAWYSKLPAESIDSFHDLAKGFVTRFQSSIRPGKSADSLKKIKQSTGESLRDFLERFNRATLDVRDLTEKAPIRARLDPGPPEIRSRLDLL